MSWPPKNELFINITLPFSRPVWLCSAGVVGVLVDRGCDVWRVCVCVLGDGGLLVLVNCEDWEADNLLMFVFLATLAPGNFGASFTLVYLLLTRLHHTLYFFYFLCPNHTKPYQTMKEASFGMCKVL
jgi:hypothetical protein